MATLVRGRLQFVAAVLLASAALLAPPATAATFIVDSVLDLPDDLSVPGVCHTSANTCTLRAAVMQANRAGVGTIVLPAGIYHLTIPPSGNGGEENGDLDLTTPAVGSPLVSIIGAGAATTVIDAGGIDRVLYVHAGRWAAISGVTLRNGSTATGEGGGIHNKGVLNLDGVVVSGNYAIDLNGGGIFNGGTLTMTTGTVSDNFAFRSGGGIDNSGTMTLIDSTIRNNGTTIDGSPSILDPGTGGGIHSSYTGGSGSLLMSGCTVAGNRANFGGGVAHAGGTVTIVNSTISNNSAMTDGGGFHNFIGTISVYNSTIVFNSADADEDQNGGIGAGVFNWDGGPGLPPAIFNLRNTLLAGNTEGYGYINDDCAGTLYTHGRNLFQDLTRCTIVGDLLSSWSYVTTLGLSPLQDNGGPTPTHALLPGGNAINGGDLFQGCIDQNGNLLQTDQRGMPRVSEWFCDIGAFEFAPANLDVDGSSTVSKYDALTDGLLVLRYLFGATGPALTNGALGGTATRTDPAVVKNHLATMRWALDVDGNYAVDPLTDGLLIVRYLSGLRGDSLVAGAVGPQAARTTATAIEQYIQSLMP